MLSYCTDYLATMPSIVLYMNCDTRLAINLSMFDLGDDDEFIFVIKNYDYIDSSYVFLFRARRTDMDDHGEVLFSIDTDTSKLVKPGAFYNFAVLANAFNPNKPTEYKKLTENGKVNIEYGAQDLAISGNEPGADPAFKDILSARLEPTDDISYGVAGGAIVDIRLEECQYEA